MTHKYEEWQSGYAWTKRAMGKKFPFADWLTFYNSGMVTVSEQIERRRRVGLPTHVAPFDAVPTQLSNEMLWYDSCKPYFSVHPELLDVFSRCRMDLPCGAIRFPSGLHTFHLKIPQPTSLRIDDKHYVRSILCNMATEASWDRVQTLCPAVRRPDPVVRKQITLWIDTNEWETTGVGESPVFNYRRMEWDADTDTVEMALNKLPFDPDATGVIMPEPLIRECIRIALSVCFLADGDDDVVIPDVLNADKYKYWATDDPRVHSELHQRAKWSGKYGWLVGTDEMFVEDAPAGPQPDRLEGPAGDRKLQYAHIRTGHWHLVWAGPERNVARVKWFRQTVVGKGLPFRRREDDP
jgi:hypothetical protein